MEAELVSKLKAGNVTNFLTWLNKQPTKPLGKIFSTGKVHFPNYYPPLDVPHLFAVVHLLVNSESDTDAKEEENIKCIFQKYIQAGCKINQVTDVLPPTKRSRQGFTPLLLAIEQKKYLVAKVLVKLGADVNIRDSSGHSPLHWVALVTSNVELMKFLLDNGAQIGNDPEGVRPLLHVAVDEGRVVLVDYLLGFGLNINTTSMYSFLQEKHWCACDVRSRYDCGPMDQYICDIEITPLGRAVRLKKLEVLGVLMRHPDSTVSLDDLHYCTLEGDSKMANMIMPKVEKELLKSDKIKGTEIFTLHQLGSKAFTLECNETMQLIQTYVDHGFNINSTSPIKEEDASCIETTLLLRAVKKNPENFELMNFLIGLGADPFINHGPKSVFNIATSRTDVRMAQIFMNTNMDISNRMNEFEDIFQMRVSDRQSHLNYIKTFVPNVQLDYKHLFKSMECGNEFLVDFILEMMPKDSSLFMRQNYSNLVGNLEAEMEMPALLENFVEQSVGSSEAMPYVCLPAMSRIIRGFHTRGYEFDQDTKPLTSIIVHATLYLQSFRHTDALILFNDLMGFRKMNWAPTSTREYPQPINSVIKKLSTRPHTVRLNHPNNLPLFDGDDAEDVKDNNAQHVEENDSEDVADGDEFNPSVYPRMYSSRCIEPKSTGIEILEDLLNRGVYAGHVSLTNLLKSHPCLIQYLQVLKKLWWAGGKADFYEIERLFNDSVLRMIGEEELVSQFREWMEIGKQKNLTLKRLVGIRIRQSMKYHLMEDLVCRALPTRVIIKLITSPD